MGETKLNRDQKFSALAKIMHWGFVLLFIYGLLKQIDNLNQLEDSSVLRFEVLFALIFLSLLGIRFIYMKKTQGSSLPVSTPKSQKLAAKIVHLGMYFCLAAIPLTGLLIGYLFSLGFKDGLLINIIIGAHEFSVAIIYWLIGIHVLASVYHRLKRDGVWSAMVPFFREKN